MSTFTHPVIGRCPHKVLAPVGQLNQTGGGEDPVLMCDNRGYYHSQVSNDQGCEGRFWEDQAMILLVPDRMESPGTKETMGQVCFRATSSPSEGVGPLE